MPECKLRPKRFYNIESLCVITEQLRFRAIRSQTIWSTDIWSKCNQWNKKLVCQLTVDQIARSLLCWWDVFRSNGIWTKGTEQQWQWANTFDKFAATKANQNIEEAACLVLCRPGLSGILAIRNFGFESEFSFLTLMLTGATPYQIHHWPKITLPDVHLPNLT